MEKFVIKGGRKLHGTIAVSGSKNVALKVLIASLLTTDEVVIENMPNISDIEVLLEILKDLGVHTASSRHTVTVRADKLSDYEIALEAGARIRASSMLIAPLLTRLGKALIPNPGGCRIGARPIDRIIKGLMEMGAAIDYVSRDGYFHAKTEGPLKGVTYEFEKNTHTGTETLLMASVLAKGQTVLKNAAEEPEINNLIAFLNSMGAKIKRFDRKIVIDGVKKLHGTRFAIMPDRNEVVTFAIAASVTDGDITVTNAEQEPIETFLEKFEQAGGRWEKSTSGIRFYNGNLTAVNITTSYHPGFMTDWQGPWAVLMVKAKGTSTIHETVYEDRLGYVKELGKMGAHIELFNPHVENPKTFYNFNLSDDNPNFFHGAKIYGGGKLHDGVVNISDLRAGATLVLAALGASGESVVYGVEHLDRGYENFEGRLSALGANIKRVKE